MTSDCTRIALHGLPIEMIVGLYPNERIEPQVILMDVELSLGAIRFGEDSTIDDTVDYAELVGDIKTFCGSRSDGLLEVLGNELCDHLMRDGRIAELKLVIHKPSAAGYLGIADGCTSFHSYR